MVRKMKSTRSIQLPTNKKQIVTAANPNSMDYNAATDRLILGHKPSGSATLIQASTGSIVKSTRLGGVPEFAVPEEASVFVNIQDKNEIVRIDARTLAITRACFKNRFRLKSGTYA
jgi:hypothetical protein